MRGFPKRSNNINTTDPRFNPNGSNSSNGVHHLWEHHHEMLYLIHKGHSNKEVARTMGVTERTVSTIRNSALGRQKLDMLRAVADVDNINLQQRLLETTPRAMDLIEEVIHGVGEGKDASLAMRMKYADKHLSRVGFGPITKSVSMSNALSREQIEEIKKRALEARQELDVTPPS